MPTEEQSREPKVYSSICAITSELAKVGIAKGRKNQQQGYAFRGIDDVYSALSGLLAAHHLCIIPRVVANSVTEKQTKSGGTLFYTTVKVEFDFVSAIDGSKHTAITVGEAMDSGDKSSNKAQSAAYKYVCLQTFCIPTEGDNDADHTTPPEVAQRRTPPAAPASRPDSTAGEEVPMEFDKAKPKPSETKVDTKPKTATAETRKWMLEKLAVYGEERVLAYARANGVLLPTESLNAWPLHKVVTSKDELAKLCKAIEAQGTTEKPKADADTTGKPSVRGVIEKVDVKEGVKGTKKWKLFSIYINGVSYTTFSATLADEADGYCRLKTEVELFYEHVEGKGNNAVSITLPEITP